MEQAREAEQSLFASKLAATGTYLLSFGFSLASLYEAFSHSPAEAVAYGFCAAVAFVGTAVIGARMDEASQAIEDIRKGGLETRI